MRNWERDNVQGSNKKGKSGKNWERDRAQGFDKQGNFVEYVYCALLHGSSFFVLTGTFSKCYTRWRVVRWHSTATVSTVCPVTFDTATNGTKRFADDIPASKRRKEDQPFVGTKTPTRITDNNFINDKIPHTPSSAVIWSQGGDVFTGFYTRRFEVPPRTPPSEKIKLSTLSHQKLMMQMDWEIPGFLYLAFIPKLRELRGSLLHRLAIRPDRLPLKDMSGGLVCLEPALIESWALLARNLLRLADIYKEATGFKWVNVPEELIPNCSTLYNAYDRADLQGLVSRVLGVRDRFAFLSGLVSFFASMLKDLSYYEIYNEMVKVERYYGEAVVGGVHPQWIKMLEVSPLFDESIERRGVIIDYPKARSSFLVPFFIKSKVPIVLRLDESAITGHIGFAQEERLLSMSKNLGYHDDHESVRKVIRRYIPPLKLIEEARERDASYMAGGHEFDHTQESELERPSTPPAPEHRSRLEFFACRERENNERLKIETAKARQARLQREEAASSFEPPGRNNTHTQIFVWYKRGRREVRTHMEHGMVPFLWREYTSLEMRFDAMRDEWDLWHEDSEDEKFPYSEDDAFYIDNSHDDNWEHTTELAPQDFSETSFRDDALLVYSPSFSQNAGHHDDAVAETLLFPLVDRMKVWFGFLPNVEPDGSVTIPDRLSAMRTQNVLRDSITQVNPALAAKLTHFVASFLFENARCIPQLDLDTFNARLSDLGSAYIRVRLSQFRAKEFDDPRSPLLELYSVEIVDIWNTVQVDRHHRRLFVWNAMTVLGVKRLPADPNVTLDDIADTLLAIGVPYIMAVDRSRRAKPVQDVRYPGLGSWTLKTHATDPLDFYAYLEKVRKLLSVCRLYKFLQYGGIVWRVASLFIHTSEVQFHSPSADALNEPQTLIGPESLIDDGVSREELELLLGVFVVHGRKSSLLMMSESSRLVDNIFPFVIAKQNK